MTGNVYIYVSIVIMFLYIIIMVLLEKLKKFPFEPFVRDASNTPKGATQPIKALKQLTTSEILARQKAATKALSDNVAFYGKPGAVALPVGQKVLGS